MTMEILTIKGNRFAVVPLDHYQKLLATAEELEDILIYDAAKARNDERFPSEVVDRLLAKEHPVKIFREYRKLTQDALAKKVRITRSYLAAIEAGNKTGSIKVLKAIAKALCLDLEMIA